MKIRRKREMFEIGAGIIGGILVVCLMIIIGVVLTPSATYEVYVVKNTTTTQKPDPIIVGGEMNIMMGGTTFWGRRTNKLARASELGIKYPFSQLDTLNRDNYDAWIAGLECPITDNGHNDYEENTYFKFNCDPDYLTEAAKWFDAFMLGNNHTDNQGAEGFSQTKTYLAEAGIQYFGHYISSNGADNCGVLVLPMRVQYDDGSETEMKIPLGFCSAHGVYAIPTEAVFQNIKKYAEVIPTIVMPHMGAEYKASADMLRTNLYRKMIDYGAEMVIGDHPHWIQNTEAYKGRLIAYSMGNFMFDQGMPETTRSAAIEVFASFGPGVDFEAWNELGMKCLENRDTCFEMIEGAGLDKISVEWKFGFKGTTTAGNNITRLANESEQAAIGERLDWVNTMRGLGL